MSAWRWTSAMLLVGALGGCSGSDAGSSAEAGAEGEGVTTETTEGAPEAGEPYALGVTMNRIDGSPQALSDYEGRVVLVVNVASRCGLTPQYAGLESLYRSRSDEGLVVLGFPANDFGGQEPGTNEEIVEFCTGRYDVTFPMFEKISVTGPDQHELYRTLSTEGGDPSWNFTKYLIDREGRVVARFDPRVKPDDPALTGEIDRLLNAG